jgi:serine O-acetyltransferase
VGVPAHIIYRNGQRVLITDPHEVKDPLSDALIALSERVQQLEALVGRDQVKQNTFAAEDQERAAYRQELEKMRDYVAMGEGI